MSTHHCRNVFRIVNFVHFSTQDVQMTISVHKAVALPVDSPLARFALPKGFPFLVIDEKAKIIEPALLYLRATALTNFS